MGATHISRTMSGARDRWVNEAFTISTSGQAGASGAPSAGIASWSAETGRLSIALPRSSRRWLPDEVTFHGLRDAKLSEGRRRKDICIVGLQVQAIL